MSDCYSCSSWDYEYEDEDYEGVGNCINPISYAFGTYTPECDGACNRQTSNYPSSTDSPYKGAILSVRTAVRLIQGVEISAENPFIWLQTFGIEDLGKFILEIRFECQKLDDAPDLYAPGLFAEVDRVIDRWRSGYGY